MGRASLVGVASSAMASERLGLGLERGACTQLVNINLSPDERMAKLCNYFEAGEITSWQRRQRVDVTKSHECRRRATMAQIFGPREATLAPESRGGFAELGEPAKRGCSIKMDLTRHCI